MCDECPICFYKLNSECIHLRCGHVYHKTCIESWKKKHREQWPCPLCRRKYYHNEKSYRMKPEKNRKCTCFHSDESSHDSLRLRLLNTFRVHLQFVFV